MAESGSGKVIRFGRIRNPNTKIPVITNNLLVKRAGVSQSFEEEDRTHGRLARFEPTTCIMDLQIMSNKKQCCGAGAAWSRHF